MRHHELLRFEKDFRCSETAPKIAPERMRHHDLIRFERDFRCSETALKIAPKCMRDRECKLLQVSTIRIDMIILISCDMVLRCSDTTANIASRRKWSVSSAELVRFRVRLLCQQVTWSGAPVMWRTHEVTPTFL